jgi:hypothetical protein
MPSMINAMSMQGQGDPQLRWIRDAWHFQQRAEICFDYKCLPAGTWQRAKHLVSIRTNARLLTPCWNHTCEL